MYQSTCPTCKKTVNFKSSSGHYRFVKYKRQCKPCSKKKYYPPEAYISYCFSCGKEKKYKSIAQKNDAIRRNYTCKSCAATRNNKKRVVTEETKQKLSNFRLGKPLSDSTKEKLRINRLKWIEKYKTNTLNGRWFNPRGCVYFDNLNKENNWNLQHALNGGEVEICGYALDAYDKIKNIVIEYDEQKHHYDKHGNLNKNDIARMNKIIKHLNCQFYRYVEKTQTLVKYN
jgi:hypothetical protein